MDRLKACFGCDECVYRIWIRVKLKPWCGKFGGRQVLTCNPHCSHAPITETPYTKATPLGGFRLSSTRGFS
ncbi:hypothetical protein Hanom_Chr07g00678931 [Helianthus anomalus]